MTMQLNWRFLIRAGLIAGAATLYVSAIGMLESFSGREVIRETVTLGQLMLVAASAAAGYFAANRLSDTRNPIAQLASGLLVGFISSIPLLALILVNSQIELRGVLVNITRNLIQILTLSQENQLSGSLLLTLSLGVAGAFGAGLALIPRRIRRAVLIGLAVTVGVGTLGELVQQLLRQVIDRDVLRAIFIRNSLSPQAALVLFVVTAVLTFGLSWSTEERTLRSRVAALPPDQRRYVRAGGVSLLAVLLLALPWLVGTATS